MIRQIRVWLWIRGIWRKKCELCAQRATIRIFQQMRRTGQLRIYVTEYFVCAAHREFAETHAKVRVR